MPPVAPTPPVRFPDPATLATSRCFPSGQLLMRTFPYRLSSSSCLIGTTSHQCARHPRRSLRYRSAARILPAPDHRCVAALTPHCFQRQRCLSKTCTSTVPWIPGLPLINDQNPITRLPVAV